MSYTAQADAARAMIAAKGGTALFSRDGDALDPVTQEPAKAVTPTTFSRKAVGMPPSKSSWQRRNGTLITQTMVELTFVPDGYDPVHSDTVIWKGKKHNIKTWVDYDPDGSGTPILMQMLIEA